QARRHRQGRHRRRHQGQARHPGQVRRDGRDPRRRRGLQRRRVRRGALHRLMAELRDYLAALRAHYGPPPPPQDEAPFERLVRALLAQNAAPKKGDEALRTLGVYGLLDPKRLLELDVETIAMAIQPAGRAKAKAARLKSFVAWFLERYEGDAGKLASASVHGLRDELLEIPGINPETADAGLLERLGLPTAVLDLH